jgi:beta-galactosidase
LLTLAPANTGQTLGPRPQIDADALAALTVARNLPTPVAAALASDDRHFSTFAYTGLGSGGVEEPLYVNALAYSDDALLYLDQLPASLDGARLIRTANADRAYWANDYMVATAGREIDFFVAHDTKIPLPGWLKAYQKTGDVVTVNKRPLALYHLRLKKDDVMRIPGNADQGVDVGSAPNLVLFSRAVNP